MYRIRTGGKIEEMGKSISAVASMPLSNGHSPLVSISQPSGNLPGHGAWIPLNFPLSFELIPSESESTVQLKCNPLNQ